MKIEATDQTLPTEPLYEPWRQEPYAGSWCIEGHFDFAALPVQDVNAWFAARLTDTLAAFSALARAWRVSFRSLHQDDVGEAVIVWQPGAVHADYDAFLDEVVRAVQAYPAPIYSLDADVDLYAYVYTPASPDQPVRVWVRLPSQLSIWGGPGNSPAPSYCFNLEHSLFAPRPRSGDDNSALATRNGPLLERALRRWEQHIGPITEVDGLSGIHAYGYALDGA